MLFTRHVFFPVPCVELRPTTNYNKLPCRNVVVCVFQVMLKKWMYSVMLCNAVRHCAIWKLKMIWWNGEYDQIQSVHIKLVYSGKQKGWDDDIHCNVIHNTTQHQIKCLYSTVSPAGWNAMEMMEYSNRITLAHTPRAISHTRTYA